MDIFIIQLQFLPLSLIYRSEKSQQKSQVWNLPEFYDVYHFVTHPRANSRWKIIEILDFGSWQELPQHTISFALCEGSSSCTTV